MTAPDHAAPARSRRLRHAAQRAGSRQGPPAPYIAGGQDPDPEPPALRRNATTAGCSWSMVITIVGAGFIIGTILALAGHGGIVRRTRPAVAVGVDPARDLGCRARRARRDAPRPDPHPVGQPADPAAPDGELRVARYLAGSPGGPRAPTRDRRARPGSRLRPRPAPRRRDRRRPVPAAVPPRRRAGAGDRWTHDPFAADIADGYVYGRGAVDMKGMVALELAVIERLVAETRAAGLDPATRPDPRAPPRRPLHLRRRRGGGRHATALAGSSNTGRTGCARPGAVNECGGVSVTVGGRRLYPIQVAEKGFAPYRIHVRGTWGHGSMPRDRQRRRARGRGRPPAGRARARSASRPVMRRFLEAAAAALPAATGAVLRGSPPASWTRRGRSAARWPPATRCTPAPCGPWSATP